MDKHIVKELSDIALEARLAGSALTDLITRLSKCADELTNEALIAEDVDEAKDAEEDKTDVESAKDEMIDAKEAIMDCALSLASLIRIYSK